MCGLIGITGTPGCAYEVFAGLMNLQHRGQDGAGILTVDQKREDGFHLQKGSGLVENIFSERSFKSLLGSAAIGHTRYSTVGQNDPNLLQPFLNFQIGIGLAHNGNIVNFYVLQQELIEKGELHSELESDSALILHLMATHLKDKEINAENVFSAIEYCTEKLVGSYSVIGIDKNGDIFGFRDPHGIRPLVLGKRVSAQKNNGNGTAYGLASETIALNFLGFDSMADVEPGEAIYITNSGKVERKIIKHATHTPCMFEWVYFARVESEFNNHAVYEARFRMGKILADQLKAANITADVVIPVPETSRSSAIALAETLGLPIRELLIKNRYVNRTFILDDQSLRQEAVRRKLFPIASEIQGKSCLIVDDSIVRGNTAAQIVKLVRLSGAREIILVSTCPPIISPCYYGIDFPSANELIAHEKSEQEIAKTLGADRVVYQTIAGLKTAIGEEKLCMGCLTGEYPTNITDGQDFEKNRLKDRAQHAASKC